MMKKTFIASALCLSLLIPSATFSQDTYVAQEKSGYNTTTKVVGSQDVFIRHQFQTGDFVAFLPLLYRAQAFEFFNELVAGHEISPQGLALVPLTLGSTVIPIGKLVTVDLLSEKMVHSFGGDQVIAVLMKAGVLDKLGYVQGITGGKNIEFSSVDFSVAKDRIQTTTFPVKNVNVQAALCQEVYQLLLSYHHEHEVTTVDTTRYQSRNNDLFNGIMETMGGNFLAGIFSPDTTHTTRSASRYYMHTNIDSFYKFNIGFSPYWGYADQAGLIIRDGDTSRWQIGAQTLGNKGVQMAEVKAALLWLPDGRQSFGSGLGFLSEELRFQTFTQNGVNHTFTSLSIPYLSFGGAVGASTFGLGLGLVNGAGNDRRNGIGLSTHLEAEFPLFTSWLSWGVDGAYHFKPDIGKEVLWDQGSIGIGVTVRPVAALGLYAGYRWLGSRSDINSDGFAFGIGYGF